jgi:hypothetical protein
MVSAIRPAVKTLIFDDRLHDLIQQDYHLSRSPIGKSFIQAELK